MKSICKIFILIAIIFIADVAKAQSKSLKLVFIRHAEKPDDGDNLNCKGLNRSLLLSAVLFRKFGKPNGVYIPALKMGEATKHTRMLQTISPFVIKYDLPLNSSFEVDDSKNIAKSLFNESGTILIVWEHQSLGPILSYLGVNADLKWPADDFDSIWIVTFRKGKPVLTKDREGLNPQAGCSF
jgi:hypothetical protein